ncbi:hypothetical protein AMAG_16145 [Allomyces macrogynus ATCC 38327]|uniref:SH3 domain-containing protein n=1 Tax=Allomyces macrogynus (strain ATCC 38327) TaxID=578462 RepID=A0A0L0T9U9_ALLM3|nr:hypothetical protein AMAG_16145 [Allomyces macrogynus ATCC 38327]|eukprot:KNE71583.1 hypothetical protein AMAG_16145 [Allomyces macrogynus ATCC 38327]
MSMKVKNPLPQDLDAECRKCAKILNQFIKPGIPGKGMPTDQFIPWDILHKAKGIAILTVVKAGFMWAGKAGSGVVVARLPEGSWSAPSAIGTAGMSFGGQIGAEVTDFVIVLNTDAAVKAFSHGGNVTLGGGLSVAAGPYGRTAEASATAKNMAAIYSYSKSKGLFAGISIEGSVILERKDANEKAYGRPVSAKELLSGTVPAPPGARELYAALDQNASAPPSAQASPLAGPAAVPAGAAAKAAEPVATTPNGVPTFLGPNALPNRIAAVSPAVHAAAAPPAYSPSSGAAAPPAPVVPTRPDTALAMFDFDAQQPGDLPFHKGDLITIVKRGDTQEQWWLGRCNGREGMFPANYVQVQSGSAAPSPAARPVKS